MKTAEEIIKKYLSHELNKSYSDISINKDLIEYAMEEYANQNKNTDVSDESKVYGDGPGGQF